MTHSSKFTDIKNMDMFLQISYLFIRIFIIIQNFIYIRYVYQFITNIIEYIIGLFQQNKSILNNKPPQNIC